MLKNDMKRPTSRTPGRGSALIDASTIRERRHFRHLHELPAGSHRDPNVRLPDAVLIVLLFCTLLMPGTSAFNGIRTGIVLFALFATVSRPARVRFGSVPIYLLLAIGINVIVGVFVVQLAEKSIVWAEPFHELARFAYYALFMLSVLRLRASFFFLLTLSKAFLLLHLGVQLVQLTNPEFVNPWIAAHFPSSEVHLGLSALSWPDFRSGSIYLNPNVYVIFPVLLLSVFLQARRLFLLKGTWLWASLCIASVVLTGSRMGLLLAFFVVIAWWARLGETSVRQWAAGLGILLASIVVAMVGLPAEDSQYGARSLDVAGGFTGSFDTKLDLLIDGMNRANPIYLAFGELGSSNASMQDMEIAHILMGFGFFGLIWYCLLVRFLVSARRDFTPFMSLVGALIVVLASLGASTVLNMSIFPMFMLVLLIRWQGPSNTNFSGRNTT